MKIKESNMGSDRSFGIIFSIVFFIISFWPVMSGESIRLWAFLIAVIILIISLTKANLLHTPNKIWFRFGLMLGNIVAPIVMGIIFFAIITPVGLIMRMLGKDLLNKKFKKSLRSYWNKREQMIGTMKNQF